MGNALQKMRGDWVSKSDSLLSQNRDPTGVTLAPGGRLCTYVIQQWNTEYKRYVHIRGRNLRCWLGQSVTRVLTKGIDVWFLWYSGHSDTEYTPIEHLWIMEGLVCWMGTKRIGFQTVGFLPPLTWGQRYLAVELIWGSRTTPIHGRSMFC